MSSHDSLPDLIDDLGALRARIAALKAQEDALRSELLSLLPARTGPHRVTAAAFSLDIVTHHRTSVNVHSLPEAIRTDPAHQVTTRTVYLKTRPLEPRAPDPIRSLRAPQQPAQYAVIETYR